MSIHQLLAAEAAYRREVIHKLSQPVTALQGSLEVALLREGSADAYQKAIETALEQAGRLALLLQELSEQEE